MRETIEQLDWQANLPRQFLTAFAHKGSFAIAEGEDRIGDGASCGKARIEAVGVGS